LSSEIISVHEGEQIVNLPVGLFLVIFILGFAVVGDMMMKRVVKPFPFVHWLGASLGALFPLFICVTMIGFLKHDASYVLVQIVLIAGTIGAVVDLPMLFSRRIPCKNPLRRKTLEALGLLALAWILLLLEAQFLES
jgi:hypothetical protein